MNFNKTGTETTLYEARVQITSTGAVIATSGLVLLSCFY